MAIYYDNPWKKDIDNRTYEYLNYGDYDSKYKKDIDKTSNRIKNYGDYKSKYGNDIRQTTKQIKNYGEYTSPYQKQIDLWSNKLLNDYDPETDANYQNYKSAYTRQGRQAMQDSIAQAAALSGGYDNSYAQSVGQQTYNQYMAALADKIPELAQAAQDMWSTRLGVLQGLDDTAYGRWSDARSDLYNRLGMYQDLDSTDYSRWSDKRDDLYKRLGMFQDLDNTDYSRWSDKRNYLGDALDKLRGVANDEYTQWLEQERYNEEIRQWEEQQAFEREKYNEGIRQWEQEQANEQARWEQEQANQAARYAQTQQQNTPETPDQSDIDWGEVQRRMAYETARGIGDYVDPLAEAKNAAADGASTSQISAYLQSQGYSAQEANRIAAQASREVRQGNRF